VTVLAQTAIIYSGPGGLNNTHLLLTVLDATGMLKIVNSGPREDRWPPSLCAHVGERVR
jgi:hypothetical protein